MNNPCYLHRFFDHLAWFTVFSKVNALALVCFGFILIQYKITSLVRGLPAHLIFSESAVPIVWRVHQTAGMRSRPHRLAAGHYCVGLFDVVEAPVIVYKSDFARVFDLDLGILVDKRSHGACVSFEIAAEPIENSGKLGSVGLDSVAQRIIHKTAGDGLQLLLQFCGSEGFVVQARAGIRSAVDGGVYAGVFELRAQDVVLNVVQVVGFVLNVYELNIPHTIHQWDAFFDVFDACHRIVLHDELDSERIVSIDPVRHLLGPRPG